MAKKIVLDARLINASGIGRYISNVLYNVQILSPDFDILLLGNVEELERFSSSRITIRDFRTPIYSMKEQLIYPQIVPVCDLFWSPHFNVPLLPIKARKRLVTIHDVFHLAHWSTLSLKQKLYAKVVYHAAVEKSDAIITVSEFSKKEVLKYISSTVESKLHVIHNGGAKVSQDLWIRQEQKEHYFLFVGNVKPHKNLRNALRAFNQFCMANPTSNFKFYIIGKREGFITGDHDVATELASMPDMKDRVVFTGFVTDEELQQYYRRAYCLVFPSLYEGFGLPPLEAMALGTPVICSNVASLPEICGNAAIYVDPMDIASIEQAMRLAVEEPLMLDKMKSIAKEQCLKFDWDKSTKAHKQVIQGLLNSK